MKKTNDYCLYERDFYTAYYEHKITEWDFWFAMPIIENALKRGKDIDKKDMKDFDKVLTKLYPK